MSINIKQHMRQTLAREAEILRPMLEELVKLTTKNGYKLLSEEESLALMDKLIDSLPENYGILREKTMELDTHTNMFIMSLLTGVKMFYFLAYAKERM